MSNEKNLRPIPKDLLFSLDIGTRNVVGTLAKKVDHTYQIIHHETMAHPERAMFDGQIHDIDKVCEIVRTVTDKIEEETGYRMEQVAIAAAGRALQTNRVKINRDIDYTQVIDKSLMDAIEMEAIQEAQDGLKPNVGHETKYYCVGYSVIRYYLDEHLIVNPKGHRGSHLEVEIIATFLPHIVVDSLYSVVQGAGLEVMNLTLEPIAAINIAIPENLRLLNLALVDVGAGTSDIAISRDGTVESYGMVSVAGDEISEVLAKQFLLDFQQAERMKIDISNNDEATITDVLGMQHTKNRTDVRNVIEPTLEYITGEVASTILELNKKEPSAVFCIGGGCQVDGFTEKLASALNLPQERVVIKEVANLDRVEFLCPPLHGPEFVTPIGIGVTAFEEREQDFLQVSVNESSIRLFNSKKLTVSDALLLVGFNARSLISSRGEAVVVNVDGEEKRFSGDYGEPAQIFVNGVMANLDTPIKNKDQILVEAAKPGNMREVKLSEVVNYASHVTLNNSPIQLVEYALVNGENKIEQALVSHGDAIETVGLKTVGELMQLVEVDPERFECTLNDEALATDEALVAGCAYFTRIKEYTPSFEVVHEGEDEVKIVVEDTLKTFVVTVNGESIDLSDVNKSMIFVDIFDHYDFNISEAKGLLVLTLNGERARYTDDLKHGDNIEIYWR